jgi:hypothetical protein
MYLKSNFMPAELYNKFVCDLPEFKDKPISIFNDYQPSYEELAINPYNILIVLEPNQLFGIHDWVIQNSHLFSAILTWSQPILDSCENSMLLPFGTTFLHSKDKYKELAQMKKEFEVSFLCGIKNRIEGQQLRQRIYKKGDLINIPKKWYYTLEGPKDPCYESSMFHICVENSKNKGYFSEKIIDALISKTIPLYYGCSDIEEYFDSRGFFTFNNEDELVTLINSLTEKDYEDRKEYIEINYRKAIYYAEYFMRFKDLLQEIITLNEI